METRKEKYKQYREEIKQDSPVIGRLISLFVKRIDLGRERFIVIKELNND